MAMVSAKNIAFNFYHKIPSRYQCMFEAAISTVYILILHTCDNALAYWLNPLKHKQPVKLFIQFIDQRIKNKSEY